MSYPSFLLAACSTLALAACASTESVVSTKHSSGADEPYVAMIDVRRDGAGAPSRATGRVFLDENGNGVLDDRETGLGGIAVSNGREVVLTDSEGGYALPVREDMAVFVIQPEGYRVPTDERQIPQFAYQHKPGGSPKPLRFGGLAPTGALPTAINFPLQTSAVGDDFTCAVLGDTQVYTNEEISHTRDSLVDDLLDREERVDCLLPVGDVIGD
ncbi:MAG: metallophosphoesterase N-terminal domain-containing protein, partial [Pseudomonadota bacterium]